jgi:hypothetical protein
MFEGAISACIVAEPQVIDSIFQELDTGVFGETIVRYWWQALSEAAKKKCSEAKRAFSDLLPTLDDEVTQMHGAVALLFVASGHEADAASRSWANTVVQDLEASVPDILKDARKHKSLIARGPILPPRGPNGQTSV